MRKWLSKSAIRHRVQLLSLPAKDPSALHPDNPDKFKSRWQVARLDATPWAAFEAKANTEQRWAYARSTAGLGIHRSETWPAQAPVRRLREALQRAFPPWSVVRAQIASAVPCSANALATTCPTCPSWLTPVTKATLPSRMADMFIPHHLQVAAVSIAIAFNYPISGF
jgi:hypothetical protein